MSEGSSGGAAAAIAEAAATHRGIPLRKVMTMILTVVLPFVVYFVLPLKGDSGEFLAAALVVAAAGLLIPLSIRQAQLVLRSEDPLFDAIRCILSGLVFLVVAFSSAYYVLGTGYEHQIQGIETKLDAVYFTMTTLATVGFGDITPTGQVGRAFVTGQMVVNFAVLAVALRVVSWALKERGGEAIARRGARALDKR